MSNNEAIVLRNNGSAFIVSQTLTEADNSIASVATNFENSIIASGSLDSNLYIYSKNSSSLYSLKQRIVFPEGAISSISMSKTGSFLVAGGVTDSIVVYHFEGRYNQKQ